MKFSKTFALPLLPAAALALLAALGLATAEEKGKFQPQVGQPGRDVVWVPTSQTVVNKMLDMARVTASDLVMDLGSGDGRTVITAAKRGATAIGIEFNPDMVALSRDNAEKAGVTARATFVQGDLFAQDLSKASVITMFLLPSINLKLRPKILSLKPGTRIVSNTFTMGDWQPDQSADIREDCQTYCRPLLWIVPAKVTGAWKFSDGELRLEQEYQMISGTLLSGNTRTHITDGRVTGDRISFLAGNTRYNGLVTNNGIEGIAQTTGTWQATRK